MSLIHHNIALHPQQDGSNEGSQFMVLWSTKKNYPLIIPVTPSFLDH